MDITRLGDGTSLGGKVLEAFSQTRLNDRPMAGVGHKVARLLCKGVFPIIEGSALLEVDGVPVALHGKTACGASLLASGPKSDASG